MSREYAGYGYENDWLALGCMVWFDGPHGDRLYGEIVRTSSNPTYFHVMVADFDGRSRKRYEVDLHQDNMSKEQ